MTFHESYGELPRKTLALINKFNVSPSDYDSLTDVYGDDFKAIDFAITFFTTPGGTAFSVFEFWNRREL